MNSTLLAPSVPVDLRPHENDRPISFNQLGCQWGGAYLLDDGLKIKEHESFPVSTDVVFGGNDISLTCLDGTMDDPVAGEYVMGESSNNGMHFSDPFYTRTNSSPMCNLSLIALAEDETDYDQKRGRPRKTRPAANAAAVSKSDAGTKSRRRASTRSDFESSGADDPKALRVREKNRVAANKCRSRRRQEEDKLKSKYEDLEQEHRRLLKALLELVAESLLLKNMLTAHGSCDCRLIQDYLESASEWVAKKLKASASPSEPSPS
ncbi:hypothetical protein ACCO45_012821 [Purpureocillium lilacinum]|uniref:Uncharacterized protein n=1 Tax=Purpureocillium lilacinum TaxID=33203 RepID=A0ACC4DA16_PURLI